MKIYTKRGDKGQTDLIGGERVSKNHPRVEAYGAIDELMAHIGVIMAYPETYQHREELTQIQNRLMECASMLATSPKAEPGKKKIPQITPQHVETLEKQIDQIDAQLPPLRSFILPGGHSLAVAQTHVARTVCRRAERRILEIENYEEIAMKYINRLSDYLFSLGRILANNANDPQTPWVPN